NLEDALRSCDYNYEKAYMFVSFGCSESNIKHDGGKDQIEFASTQPNRNNALVLEISADFASKLHSLFGDGANGFHDANLPLKNIEKQGTILLPLESSVASAIYDNLIRYIRDGATDSGEDDSFSPESVAPS